MYIRYFLPVFLFLFSTGYAQQQQYSAPRPLSLEEAVSIALNNNPDVRASEEKTNSAKGRLLSSFALPQPEVSLSYEYIPSGVFFRNFGERSLGISQSFEFPTNYFLRRSKYKDERLMAESELEQTRLSIAAAVKSAYYNALAKLQEISLARENLEIAGDFHRKADIRFNSGEATHLERQTAKVQYSEALSRLNIRENELKSALAELGYSMGYGKDDHIGNLQLTDTLGFDSNGFSLDYLLETAQQNNSRLKISELKLSSSKTEKALAWSGLLPEFSISYYKQSQNGLSGYYGASFGVTVPLWFMFDQRGKIQEAEANRAVAEHELKGVRNEFYLKVSRAFNDYQIADKQVRLYQSDILPESEEIYRAASRSYEAGEITYVEFLQAKQTLISSKENYINSLLLYNQAVISLEEAVGKRLK